NCRYKLLITIILVFFSITTLYQYYPKYHLLEISGANQGTINTEFIKEERNSSV
uniref:Uncharacterized protein n=1 Tax=Ciona savignyi TaxID=51511 RepID=H2Z8T2_CIOSA